MGWAKTGRGGAKWRPRGQGLPEASSPGFGRGRGDSPAALAGRDGAGQGGTSDPAQFARLPRKFSPASFLRKLWEKPADVLGRTLSPGGRSSPECPGLPPALHRAPPHGEIRFLPLNCPAPPTPRAPLAEGPWPRRPHGLCRACGSRSLRPGCGPAGAAVPGLCRVSA